MKLSLAPLCIFTGTLLYSKTSFAHHVMDGDIPVTFFQGLVSGLGHPVIDMTHFAFICGIGILCGGTRKSYLLPLPFLFGAIGGIGIQMNFFEFQMPEVALAGTLVLLATLLLYVKKISFPVIVPVFLVCGTLHGYAYGEGILGAEQGPIAAYLLGLMIIQYGIATIFIRFSHLVQAQEKPAMNQIFAGLFGMAGLGLMALAAISPDAF